MLRLYADSFASLMVKLTILCHQIENIEQIANADDVAWVKDKLAKCISEVKNTAEHFPMSRQTMGQIDALERVIGLGLLGQSESGRISIKTRIEVMRDSVMHEIGDHAFMVVPPKYRRLIDTPARFSPEALGVLPDVQRDAESAGRCLAFGEWTASVFHSMRVLEHSLRAMAKRFGVDFAQKSWHKVIDEIEKAVDAIRESKAQKGGLTSKDQKEIKDYSEAAIQFRYFKDAWRNHSMHAREHYDERIAQQVYNHVRDFTQQIVNIELGRGTTP